MNTLKDYAAGIVENKKTIAYFAILTALIAGLVCLLLPNIYEARAVMIIRCTYKIRPSALVFSEYPEKIQDFDLLPLNVESCIELLFSPQVVQELIYRLRLDRISPDKFTVKNLTKNILKTRLVKEKSANLALYYLPALSYAPVINLVVEYKDRKLAKDMANAWARILVEKTREIDRKAIDDVLFSVREYQSQAKERIESLEGQIKDLSRKQNMPPEEKEVMVSRLRRDLEEQQESYELNKGYINRIALLLVEKGSPGLSIAAYAVEPQEKDYIFPNRTVIIIVSFLLAILFSSFWFSFRKVFAKP